MGNRSFFNALHNREGDFLLDGDPETLCLLYQTGLGDRNSQGFGMFRMLL